MSFWSSLTGQDASDAANAAAGDTYRKQQAATAGITNYGNEYAGKFADLSKGYDPYVSAGNSALERMMAGLGLGGNQEAFTNAYRSIPGYQSGLETGSRAITGNAAARGLLNSSATAKGLQRYGSDYEDKRSGDYLSRLMGLSGMGQQATGQQIGTVGQGLQGQLATRQSAYGGDMNAAGTIGQGQIAGANAEAAGSQNLLNAGLKLGGMAMGAFGMPSFGSPSAYTGIFGSGAASGGNNGGVVWGR
jgi:hypothetical protein